MNYETKSPKAGRRSNCGLPLHMEDWKGAEEGAEKGEEKAVESKEAKRSGKKNRQMGIYWHLYTPKD